MSFQTFRNAVKLCGDIDENIEIGGGEPTVHPKFFQFLGYAIVHNPNDEMPVWLATNGKKTKSAMRLITLKKHGIINVVLSQDRYHEPIDHDVVWAFEQLRSIRNTTQYNPPLAAGRGKKIKEALQNTYCMCPSYFVKPNGDVHFCGCENSPKLGNVNTGVDFTVYSSECQGYPPT